jgi:hypothetical protein
VGGGEKWGWGSPVVPTCEIRWQCTWIGVVWLSSGTDGKHCGATSGAVVGARAER